ncbi:hypothetical protein [Streptomyces sp. Inha503]|uniref:hypothetical protein n=1 Tax=Streptomyces sp. Inha503 TaxID=3383314 RepID=UPI00399F7629
MLPNAKSVKDGVPVGYPRTLNGAISAAAHFYDILDPFDPAATEKQHRITAEPGKEKQISDDALRFSMRLRNTAGLPLLGESDNANYYTLQSRAYRVSSRFQGPGEGMDPHRHRAVCPRGRGLGHGRPDGRPGVDRRGLEVHQPGREGQ